MSDLTRADLLKILRAKEDQIKDMHTRMIAARQSYSILRRLHDRALIDLDTTRQAFKLLKGGK